MQDSDFDGVAALTVLALGRCDGQAHFLADGPGQEAAYGMWLPTGSSHQILGCYAARPLEQFQNRVSLAACARGLGFLSGFGRFLRRCRLLGRLPLLLRNVGALWRNTRLFGGFWLLTRCRGLGAPVFFCSRCVHVFSFSGSYRDHIHHSSATGKQVDSVGNRIRRWNGDGHDQGVRLAAFGI